MLILTPKAPNEVIFYEFDWGPKRLVAGETITAAGWFVAGGTVKVAASPAPSIDGSVTRVYLEEGEVDDESIVTNWVETNLNPRRELSGKLKVKIK